jgi:dolichol-phosphate mannosyltransferase
MTEPPELLVVLPIYNERESITHVIDGWMPVLREHVGNFVILAINDGSTDDSAKILHGLQEIHGSRLEVLNRENRGHGQTCLEGYRIAVDRGIPYILQIDSDGQSDPRFFPAFWKIRANHDVIYGERRRMDGWQRIVASFTLRSLLGLIEGVDCTDANVPYRLMDTMACREACLAIPDSIDLANVALAVLLKRTRGIRHGTVPIDFPPRHGGEPSVPVTKFLRKGTELFIHLRSLRKQPTS